MSEPTRVITVAPDWQPWQVGATDPWQVPALSRTTVRWGPEVVVAAAVAVYSLVLGGAVGLIWPRVSPHIRLVAAIDGSEAATKALLGDDVWFALLGIVAGVVSVALLAVVARDAGRGPGAMVGLAVGGVLGSLVAAHVGHTAQQPHLSAALRSAFPDITSHSTSTILGYFDFKVRARAVLMAWPLAAVLVHSAIVALRYRRLDSGR